MKKFLSMVLIVTMLMSAITVSGVFANTTQTTANSIIFTDVKADDWYYEAVMFAYENNITSGVSATEFAPNGKVTRGQFITMLCRAYGISEMTGDNFDDCGDTWYTGYLAAAKQLGISNGVGNNKFAPEKEITREEMVTLIYNYLKSVGKADETANATSFADDNMISDWAKSAVAFASSNGYVNGKDNNMFDPQGTATRAELAQLLSNFVAEKKPDTTKPNTNTGNKPTTGGTTGGGPSGGGPSGSESTRQYSLTFNTNGGSSISSIKDDKGTKIDLSKYKPTKDGYNFVGWYEEGNPNEYITEVTLNKNKTVYAKWIDVKPTKYTLTFNTNGGSEISAVTENEGTKIDLSKYKPTKSKYNFVGWYLEGKPDTYINDITLTKNTTIYAKWSEVEPTKYTLTFNTYSEDVIDDVTENEGSVINLDKYVPERDGYTFVGWYAQGDTKETLIKEVTLNKNTVVCAKWSENPPTQYTLTFDTKDGDKNFEPIKDNEGTKVNLGEYTPTKSGYNFVGWYVEGKADTLVTEVTLNENVTVCAKWSKNLPKEYTLTFDTNGGNKIASETATEGTTIKLDDIPVKTGYEFIGWYVKGNSGTIVTEVTLNKNITVVAKWEKVQYTLSFDTDGGSDISSVTKDAGTTVSLGQYKPEKEGYEFVGWYTEANPGKIITSITLNSNTTIFAKWEKLPEEYTLTFNTNGGEEISSVTIIENVKVNLNEYKPTKENTSENKYLGYEFKGWYIEGEPDTIVTSITPTSDITVCAKWKEFDNTEIITNVNNAYNELLNPAIKWDWSCEEITLNYILLGLEQIKDLTNECEVTPEFIKKECADNIRLAQEAEGAYDDLTEEQQSLFITRIANEALSDETFAFMLDTFLPGGNIDDYI